MEPFNCVQINEKCWIELSLLNGNTWNDLIAGKKVSLTHLKTLPVNHSLTNYIYTYIHTHTHTHTYIYIYIYIYLDHHVVPPAWISLTLSRHFPQSFIASGKYSGLHAVSSHSCCMYVRAGRPAIRRGP